MKLTSQDTEWLMAMGVDPSDIECTPELAAAITEKDVDATSKLIARVRTSSNLDEVVRAFGWQ